MHQIQKILLNRLLLQNHQRYSSLTSGYNFEDNIVFHLKQLIANNFIQKQDGSYSITAAGIKEIKRYDTPKLKEMGVKMFFIGFLCESKGDYLIRGHPAGLENFYNLPSGKPYFGEGIEKTLVRTFYECTGVKLPLKVFKYLSLHLKTVKTSDGEVIFDDAFAIYQVALSDKDREGMKLKPGIVWLSLNKIKKLPNRWPEIDICILQKGCRPYLVYTFTSNHILE